MSEVPPPPFRTETRGDLTFVHLTGPKIGLEARESLYGLIEREGIRKLALNFDEVQVLSSAPIGMLVDLRNRIGAVKGMLVLCQVSPDIREILRLTSVEDLFSIVDTENDVIAMFHQR
jgi:anti-sigma B factor antagonist